MYDDSNQAQRDIYNRPQQESQYANPAHEPILTRKLPGKFNNRFMLLLGFIIVFILACAGGVTSLALYIGMLNQPPQCTGNCVMTSMNAKEVVQGYYAALKDKNYAKAISYFDPKGTITVNNVRRQISLSQLRALDTGTGQMQNYQISEAGPVFNIPNEVMITVTVTRQNILLSQQYPVSLILKQEKEVWKIISADGV